MEELIIARKHSAMIKYANGVLEKFPRNQRAFTDMIRVSMYTCWKYITIQQFKRSRLETLRLLDEELHVLQSYIRLASDLGFIRGNPETLVTENGKRTQYAILSTMLVEEGRIIGGMIKSAH